MRKHMPLTTVTNMRIYFNFCFKSEYFHMVQNLKDTKENKEEIIYVFQPLTSPPWNKNAI